MTYNEAKQQQARFEAARHKFSEKYGNLLPGDLVAKALEISEPLMQEFVAKNLNADAAMEIILIGYSLLVTGEGFARITDRPDLHQSAARVVSTLMFGLYQMGYRAGRHDELTEWANLQTSEVGS